MDSIVIVKKNYLQGLEHQLLIVPKYLNKEANSNVNLLVIFDMYLIDHL